MTLSAGLVATALTGSDRQAWAVADQPALASAPGARANEELLFVNGALNLPSTPHGTNNRGVLTDQTLPGMTHVEIYLTWRLLEPARDQWAMGEFDEMLRLCRDRGLKCVAFPSIGKVPEWFRSSRDYQPVIEMTTGEIQDFPSPWAPGTYRGFDHFYAYLAAHYSDAIDIIMYFIEVGLMSGHGIAFWCGDAYAREDFRAWMLARYGDLSKINAAWGSNFALRQDVAFPSLSRRMHEPRRWVDFVLWYQDSQLRALRRHLGLIRRHFPKTHIDVPMGFGWDAQSDGCDRTAVCRAVSDFRPISVRSTHGSFNRDQPPRAYWFYKRMAPMCHHLNVPFGTEPPGGDLRYDEIRRQYFEDASAGATLIFQYYQNFHLRPPGAAQPQVIADYKRVLRPGQSPFVDIGVLYPTTQMMLDLVGFPEGQLRFCSEGREFFDYDLIDENLIEWGLLSRYRVLLHTSGRVFRQSTLSGIETWVRAGGTLIARSALDWRSIDTDAPATARWTQRESAEAKRRLPRRSLPAVQPFELGSGRIFLVLAKDVSAHLAHVVDILAAMPSLERHWAPLHGFKSQSDGTYVTEFPDGRLAYNVVTHETQFHPLS